MPAEKLALLIGVFFLTSVLSVITGSTSLITVPVMISLGIEPHRAVATNMLALTFMSVGGTLPFLHAKAMERRRLALLLSLTIVGSIFGALILVRLPVAPLQTVIAIAMMAVAGFSLIHRNVGLERREIAKFPVEISGYLATFALAVYGGFFSGGYVTLLTTVFVMLFGMTFLQAVATTKLMNVFSSGVATLVFLGRGIVDLKLGFILGIAMFGGGLLGGRIALHLNVIWLRRIFIAAVLALAIKMLLLTPVVS
ncbi:MAG TPA: sulfite exporter TauE/SafE family protein [Terriglobales bacterium]|nr:sulfite exporter TauE/SafE family protein [Terriglobales bacterium]